jgi:C4-dicarboxylate transporter DctM subunit
VLFLITIGGLYVGWVTPTEAACLGAFFSLVMMIGKRRELRKLSILIKKSFTETIRTTCMIFLILIGAGLYSFFLTLAQVPQALSTWITGLSIHPLGIVAIFLLFLVPMGMFLDGFSMLIITLPIAFPVVVNQLGFSPIWFGILCTKLVELGCITPPVGMNVYVIAGMNPDVPLADVFRGCLWFMMLDLIIIIVLFFFPVISTWLPSTMYVVK